MAEPILRLRDVTVRYGEALAVEGVDLDVEAKTVVTLVGANGAGKTTLLRAISGLLRPARGSIELDGESLVGLAPHRIVGRGVAHVPEGRRLWPRLTVEETLELGAYPPPARARRRESLEWVFALFPRLAERRRQEAGTLSGGEQQMLAIGRGLMARPRLLLLDEPSLGLAPVVTTQIFGVVREVHRGGVTVLLVEQNVDQALAVAAKGYVLEVGRIVRSGPAAELAADPAIRRAYLGV